MFGFVSERGLECVGEFSYFYSSMFDWDEYFFGPLFALLDLHGAFDIVNVIYRDDDCLGFDMLGHGLTFWFEIIIDFTWTVELFDAFKLAVDMPVCSI